MVERPSGGGITSGGQVVSFARPPVVEVVAGLVFSDYPAELTVFLSAFWTEELRREFPSLQLQPPYTPPEEQFDDRIVPAVSFQLGATFPAPRLWAAAEDGQELVQLQADWLAHNWRKVKPDGEYDRWEARRAALTRTYDALKDYLTGSGIAMPQIRQCEVTYVNHISLESMPEGHGAVGSFLKGQEVLSRLGNVEQLTLQTSYKIDTGTRPVGRLHVKLNPALDASGKPVYVLELTARSAPATMDLETALSFLDSGRNAINNAFMGLTTESAHQRWGFEG